MKITLKRSLFFLSIAMFSIIACGDDDDGTTPAPTNNNGGNGDDTTQVDTTQVTDIMKATVGGNILNYDITLKQVDANDNIVIRGIYRPDTSGMNDETFNLRFSKSLSQQNYNILQEQSIVPSYIRDGITFNKKLGNLNIIKLDTLAKEFEATFSFEVENQLPPIQQITLTNGEVKVKYD